MAQSSDLEQIKQALVMGRLTVLDPDTGYQGAIYTCCTTDDQDSPIYRTEKSGQDIARVIFRCPTCDQQFDVTPDAMFLR